MAKPIEDPISGDIEYFEKFFKNKASFKKLIKISTTPHSSVVTIDNKLRFCLYNLIYYNYHIDEKTLDKIIDLLIYGKKTSVLSRLTMMCSSSEDTTLCSYKSEEFVTNCTIPNIDTLRYFIQYIISNKHITTQHIDKILNIFAGIQYINIYWIDCIKIELTHTQQTIIHDLGTISSKINRSLYTSDKLLELITSKRPEETIIQYLNMVESLHNDRECITNYILNFIYGTEDLEILDTFIEKGSIFDISILNKLLSRFALTYYAKYQTDIYERYITRGEIKYPNIETLKTTTSCPSLMTRIIKELKEITIDDISDIISNTAGTSIDINIIIDILKKNTSLQLSINTLNIAVKHDRSMELVKYIISTYKIEPDITTLNSYIEYISRNKYDRELLEFILSFRMTPSDETISYLLKPTSYYIEQEEVLIELLISYGYKLTYNMLSKLLMIGIIIKDIGRFGLNDNDLLYYYMFLADQYPPGYLNDELKVIHKYRISYKFETMENIKKQILDEGKIPDRYCLVNAFKHNPDKSVESYLLAHGCEPTIYCVLSHNNIDDESQKIINFIHKKMYGNIDNFIKLMATPYDDVKFT
jgi:hypothetical protein